MDPVIFTELLKQKCQLVFTRPVVAGISGGPDSLCMLDLLSKSGIDVIAIHVNHQLRPEAEVESVKVSEYCRQKRILCIIEKIQVISFAQKWKLSIEECARILRYQFLFEKAKELSAQAVLVAHNADDQAETVLMHLLRGSGLSGLKGMQIRSFQSQWSESIPLIRPLITTSRKEILDYCKENQLLPSYDPSNNDTRYFRNRIRQELIPELASYNPRIKEHLVKMADVAYFEDEYLGQIAEKAQRECTIQSGERFIQFSKRRLVDLHPALLRRILRQSIYQINPTLRDIDYEVINRAQKFLSRFGRKNHLLLIADVEIIKDGRDKVIICDQRDRLTELWPFIEDTGLKTLNLNGTTFLDGGWQIVSEKKNRRPETKTGGMSCCLDADKIEMLLISRYKPGDRFTPFNLKGKSIKLSDFWTKNGLPEKARINWPLIITPDGEIVWVPGYQISDAYKITPETQRIILLLIERH